MRSKFLYLLAIFSVFLLSLAQAAQHGKAVSLWLTTRDRTSLLAKQPEPLHFQKPGAQLPVIDVNDKQKYQSIDGFGFALTGGSAQLLMRMNGPQRTELLRQLFGTGDSDIGVSYLRVSIGSSDMNDHAFTYDDLAAGETDPSLAKFDPGPDSTSVIPVLKEILAIDPSFGPHTGNGGCPVCEGAITLDGDAVTRNIAYYTVAHASKFVRPGSVRIESNSPEQLPNVAFAAPGGKRVVIVANIGPADQDFEIHYHGKAVTTSLKAGAVGTYVW